MHLILEDFVFKTDAFFSPASQYEGKPMHRLRATARLNLDRLLTEQGKCLVHSDRSSRLKDGGEMQIKWECLAFKMSEDLFIEIEAKRDGTHQITAWSAQIELIERVIREWIKNYSKRTRSKQCCRFYILEKDYRDFESCLVEGRRPFILDPSELAAHYGSNFPVWEEAFVKKLNADQTGVAILTGQPGTGKTSLIRHLIYKLRKSHRFFYLPVSEYSCLSSPSLVSFWLRQQRDHPKMKFVVILEDAEAILAERDSENGNAVSNLLNMADGLLGDFLKMRLICTINCKLDRLDRALTRHGRLIGSWEFKRLPRAVARNLAYSKGFQLPSGDDFSLAEIYSAPPLALPQTARAGIGFCQEPAELTV